MHKKLLALAAILFSTSALAQGQLPNHSMPIAGGPGTGGWRAGGPCGVNQVLSWTGGSTADPTCVSGGGGGGGTPGGSDTMVQFNLLGSFAGDAGFEYLTNGVLGVTAFNPKGIANNNTDRYSTAWSCGTDATTSFPGFSNESCVKIALQASNGHELFGGGTNAKSTFLPLSVSAIYNAAGQRFAVANTVTCYGEGDCFVAGDNSVTFAGADINGDEGQGWWANSKLHQQGFLVQTTISTVTRTTCNTTLTQSVTASTAAQTVTVASTTGCNVNDWVVLGQAVATASPNITAMKLTAVGVGSITGLFQGNYSNGATVTPALVLTAPSTFQSGQLRAMVNLSGSSYSTGTVTAPTSPGVSGALTGTGTTWTNNMVGGSSTNIGCISMDGATYTGTPFDGTGANGPLRSWYQITAVSSTTSIGIFSTSTAGDSAYNAGGIPGNYIIRPCARVLWINHQANSPNVDGLIVLESTSTTWTVGDTIETAITPFPDVSGFLYSVATYTKGGSYRAGIVLSNDGARTFGTGITIKGNMPVGGGSDAPVTWDTGISTTSVNTGIGMFYSKVAAISMNGTGNSTVCPSDNCGKLDWSGYGSFLKPNSANSGMDFQMIATGTGGLLSSTSDIVIGTGTSSLLKWTGAFQVSPVAFSALPTCNAGLQGTMRVITNSNTITFAAVVAGGGSNIVLAMCDGTNWTVH